MIEYDLARSETDLRGILELQKKNSPGAISPEEAASQGFVTVRHDLDILGRMNREAPSIIAKDKDKVIGYCLAMTRNFKKDIPVLIPMFNTIDKLSFKNEPLLDANYIVSGQVCIDKAYRGKGILDGLYNHYREAYKDIYKYIITEIVTTNQRSVKAHLRVGFEHLHSYIAPDNTDWDIVIWDWNS
ncbi:GNAT family N-acetyltransferase [Sinomicrobium weinanense]|uniref:GNAT family N-acetyltransferase n=1 Tax=Sinomicrobium weinanense TaxID=2842200 RepID=A0A926JUS5_9FLAO|nr:GNAT family N-acetyltransferase [Sinomicrobium weinanense]MBC9797607.1 GNAT family N-acetyltransferase [Sinomicrobium weinanense]MBU3123429.1 GNAT family N-acetyltransferase [Sinomicrobium weinanense]